MDTQTRTPTPQCDWQNKATITLEQGHWQSASAIKNFQFDGTHGWGGKPIRKKISRASIHTFYIVAFIVYLAFTGDIVPAYINGFMGAGL